MPAEHFTLRAKLAAADECLRDREADLAHEFARANAAEARAAEWQKKWEDLEIEKASCCDANETRADAAEEAGRKMRFCLMDITALSSGPAGQMAADCLAEINGGTP